MIPKEELKKIITDTSVSDDIIFETLKTDVEDVDDREIIPPTDEEILELQEIYDLLESVRPDVLKRLENFILDMYLEEYEAYMRRCAVCD
jgi:hypothetical protein